ncbi:MAG: SusF/SusE family outer membrane protein [Paludibacter sp.]|nr:SusF/SusE family outer membrane protein [Paludibacter sp.]
MDIVKAGPLAVTVSDTAVTLSQKNYANAAVKLNWTTGTNNGTGASISYILQVDKKGNEMATPVSYDMGKGVYSKSFIVKELNDSLLKRWGGEVGKATQLEARVVSTVYSNPVSGETSPVIGFSVKPYQQVSSSLYMVGSATPVGWNIGNAVELTPSVTEPWVFTYKGLMSAGSYKFAVNREGCWCQDFYTADAVDATKMVHNIGGSGADIQWQITKGGPYQITANLLDLTITVAEFSQPLFSKLWIVGDASPSGWNIDSPKEFTRSSSNPFIFTYEANFVPGDFKIFAGNLGDWCGNWYRPLVNHPDLTLTDVAQNSGCDMDNKWQITSSNAGRYKITLDTYGNKIKINPVMLYIIGDASPNGWNINSPTPMTYADGVYTFTGPLTAGEFKFSKYKGDWCDDDWIIATSANQSVSNASFTIRHGCEGDDNKWKVQAGEAGNYVITINLNTQLMTIIKQ